MKNTATQTASSRKDVCIQTAENQSDSSNQTIVSYITNAIPTGMVPPPKSHQVQQVNILSKGTFGYRTMAQPPVVVYNPAHNFLLPPPNQQGKGSYKIQTLTSSGRSEKPVSTPKSVIAEKASISVLMFSISCITNCNGFFGGKRFLRPIQSQLKRRLFWLKLIRQIP